MGLIVLGLSHNTAPVELREKLAIPAPLLGESFKFIKNAAGIREGVVLSTCNRVEVYARPHPSRKDGFKDLVHFFGTIFTHPHLKSSLYQYEGQPAVLHLFRVASGLDSMVVGESEILGQVKNAYRAAHQAGVTGKITNVLFQRALYVGKQVRNQTGISEGSSSVGSVAVNLAGRIFGSLKDKRVLILGAGKMAEVTARHLRSQKADQVTILNRNLKKAEELAGQLNGKAGPLTNLKEELINADIVVASTASKTPIITKELIDPIMDQRQQRSLYLIDIAVPRNIDPGAHDIDNVYVYNIDDFKSLVHEDMGRRKKEMEAAQKIVEESATEFYFWIQSVLEGKFQGLRHTQRSGPNQEARLHRNMGFEKEN